MRTITLALSLVATVGCESFGNRKTQSNWIALARAADVQCATWPKRAQDLRIDEIAVISGARPAYLTSGVKRDGGPLYAFASFPGEPEVDPEALTNLALGRGALLAGGGQFGAQTLVAVIQNFADKSVLEMREPRSNLVRQRLELRHRQVRDVRHVADGGLLWIAYQTDDGSTGLVRLQLERGGKLAALETSLGPWREPLVLVPYGRGELLVARRDDGATVLQLTRIARNGQPLADARLELEVTSELESWNLANLGGSLHAAWVDGDSLVGQANLKVAAVTLDGPAARLASTRSTPLKDVHVNEPILLGARGDVQVLSLQWIDEESTVAAYDLTADALGRPSYRGIFPKGSRIVAQFVDEKEREQYIVVRHKVDESWSFRICRL